MGEIKSLQHQVDEWIRTVGVRYFNELTNMAMLTEEVGKLPELLPEDMENNLKKNRIRVKISVRNLQMFFLLLCAWQIRRERTYRKLLIKK